MKCTEYTNRGGKNLNECLLRVRQERLTPVVSGGLGMEDKNILKLNCGDGYTAQRLY